MKAKILIACGIIAGFLGCSNATAGNPLSEDNMDSIESMMEISKISTEHHHNYQLLLTDIKNANAADLLSAVVLCRIDEELPSSEVSYIATLNGFLTKQNKSLRKDEIELVIDIASKVRHMRMKGESIYQEVEENGICQFSNIGVEYVCLYLLTESAKQYKSANLMTGKLWHQEVTRKTNELAKLFAHVPTIEELRLMPTPVQRPALPVPQINAFPAMQVLQVEQPAILIPTPARQRHHLPPIQVPNQRPAMELPPALTRNSELPKEKRGDALALIVVRDFENNNTTGLKINWQIREVYSHQELLKMLRGLFSQMYSIRTEKTQKWLEYVRPVLTEALWCWGWDYRESTLNKPANSETFRKALRDKCQ